MTDTAIRDEAERLYHDHRFAEAAQAAFVWVEQNPEDWHGLQILADSCMMAGYLDEAEKLFRHGAEQRNSPFYKSGLATVLIARGRMDEAKALLKEVLAVDPRNVRAWSELSSVHKFRKDDPILRRLSKAAKRKDIPDDRRSFLYYALCKAMNDLGKWDHAWDNAAKGAALTGIEYDPGELWEWNAHQREVYDAEFLAEKPGRGVPTDAPIFIVGLPRSGTTLVEMIITTTGKVRPMGELVTIPQVCSAANRDDSDRGHPRHRHAWTRRWRDEAFTQAGQFYLDDVKRRCDGEMPVRFVDKLPGNMFYLAQIALFLPRARIIRMHRHPLDTCASLYLGRFTGGHRYIYRTDWLAEAWKAYKDSADTMIPLLPNPVLDVVYEDLVSDPEPQIRRLLSFLDLDWDPRCLTPGSSDYTTITRSRGQVRSAINTRAVGRWRRYRNRIGPLAEALGIDLAELDLDAKAA